MTSFDVRCDCRRQDSDNERSFMSCHGSVTTNWTLVDVAVRSSSVVDIIASYSAHALINDVAVSAATCCILWRHHPRLRVFVIRTDDQRAARHAHSGLTVRRSAAALRRTPPGRRRQQNVHASISRLLQSVLSVRPSCLFVVYSFCLVPQASDVPPQAAAAAAAATAELHWLVYARRPPVGRLAGQQRRAALRLLCRVRRLMHHAGDCCSDVICGCCGCCDSGNAATSDRCDRRIADSLNTAPWLRTQPSCCDAQAMSN